jgi:hypothetical protein
MNHSGRLLAGSLLILSFLSLTLLAIYVHMVYLFNKQTWPELFFWTFASAFSVSIMLLWILDGSRKITLLAVFASAFIMISLPFLRFHFYGTDLVGEYFVADVTHELGKWTPERAAGGRIPLNWFLYQRPNELLHRYFSTTSVTILPAVVSEVAGLSTRQVLWVLLSLVSMSVVIIGYLIVRICLGHRIAALSSIVFIFSSFYTAKFPMVLREDVALLFLLLSVFCILRGGGKFLLISLVSLMLLPMSHYALVYFAFLFLLFLFVSKKAYENGIFANILRKVGLRISNDSTESMAMSKDLLLYSIVVGLCWLLFVAYSIFVANLGGIGESFKVLLGLEPSSPSYFQKYVVFSSLGPFHTIIQWLERVMAIFGLFLALKVCKNVKTFSFVVAEGGLLAVTLALAFFPTMSLLYDLDRTMHVALLGFSAFIATTIFSISKNIGKLLAIIFVTLFLLETLQSPIQYSSVANLTREEYIFSFTHATAFYEPSDFYFAKWVESFTNESAVFASDSNGYSLCLIAKRICLEPLGANVSDTISLLESGKTDYFLVLSYLEDYMEFTSKNGTELQFNLTDIAKLLGSNDLNRIYDNSRVRNFAHATPTP